MSALERALERVEEAKRRLARARAARAALEQPRRQSEPHYSAAYDSLAELHAAQGGGVVSPGIDTAAVAQRITDSLGS